VYKRQTQKAVKGDGYPFWIYVPNDYKQYERTTPLIIFLHGASLRGTDMESVLKYGPLDAVKRGLEIPALIVAPQNPKGHWVPQKINDILEWMQRHYTFNPQRVYVIGMSLGGYGTLDFAGTYPEKVAAAIALCGGSTLRNYQKLGELPLWIIHGTADKAVKVEESEKVVDGMKDLNRFFAAFDYPAEKTATFLVPASIRMLIQFSSDQLAKLADKMDFIETGAAAIAQADMEKLCELLPKTRLYNTYASTETGIIATYNYNDGRCLEGCLGRPMSHSRVTIIPEQSSPI